MYETTYIPYWASHIVLHHIHIYCNRFTRIVALMVEIQITYCIIIVIDVFTAKY